MAHLAGLGIIHRDLTSHNVLLFAFDPQNRIGNLVKLCDYGLSRLGQYECVGRQSKKIEEERKKEKKEEK